MRRNLDPRMSVFCCVALFLTLSASAATSTPLGIFEGQQDVGTVPIPGAAHYDASKQTYSVTGNGDNMWFAEDDFHFVWKKVSGDVSLSADIGFVGETGNNHRKAVLMIRQSLDTNSAFVDVARHGDGLTSLQFRDSMGGNTHEVESNVSAPQRVRIEKRGDYFYAFISGKDGKLEPAGASTHLALTGPFYVGIGVSSHDKTVSETAIFSHVKLTSLPPATGKPVLASTLETITVASTDRRVAYFAPAHFEAPNWSRDGSFLLFNQEGKIYSLPVGGTAPTLVDIGADSHVNNDHGISPNGQSIAISDQPGTDQQSSIYVAPIRGGAPTRVTQNSPSYWHGWSPDGKTLAFTGQRNGNFDIYTIPVTGGQEQRLTTAKGLDDGPEYSPDGEYIYFNSERTGSMQLWRMKADGTDQEQVLTDDTNDWFPHISPNGKWLVFLVYVKGVTGHPGGKEVELRLMSMTDKKVHLLAKLYGGQGTINVPSWSPDSLKLAFVSYELLPEESVTGTRP
jgi:TolB protein